MKVALVYDRVNKWGGAERVLLALHELFPNAPLFTSVYAPGNASWAKEVSVKTTFLQNLPFARTSHELFAMFMPVAFENMTFDEYDLVISVTSEAAKGIITKPQTKHLCYCLTPTRYLWSGYDDYFSNSLFRTLAKPVVSYLRVWDKVASTRPDVFIAISQEVKRRIATYYGRDAAVVYPPATFPTQIMKKREAKEPFVLCVSRLVPYKRIDLAILACNKLGVQLKIVGEGSDKSRLMKLAGPTVSFLGHVPDEQLAVLYQSSFGLIFPGVEDFGLVVVEAQSYGKPVLAYKAGGTLETIQEGKTGLFFSSQSQASITSALSTFLSTKFDEDSCKKNARQYSFSSFKEHFLSIVDDLMLQ